MKAEFKARFKNSGDLGAYIFYNKYTELRPSSILGPNKHWITSSQLFQNLQFKNNTIIPGKYWSQTEKFLS